MAQSEWEKPLSPAERLEQAKKAEAEAKKALKAEKKAAKEERKRLKKESKNNSSKKVEKQAVKPAPNDNKPLTNDNKFAPSDNKAVAIPTNIKNSKDAKYLQPDAVPMVDGKVVYSLKLNLPGRRANEVYDRLYSYLDNLAQGEKQIESSIVLVNKTEHIIVAKYNEWLEFSRNFVSLDRTKFYYTIIAKCADNGLELTMERLSYKYEEERENGFKITAEEWIADKNAVNKKHTKLNAGSAKFRRKTIDRKDQIFDEIRALFN